jgi:hypothetical protein
MGENGFAATCGVEVIEYGYDLADLLAVLAEIHGGDVDEDVAIWQGGRLIVVRRPGGALVWVRGEYRAAAA